MFTDCEHAALCGHAGAEGGAARVHAGRVPRKAVAPREIPTERQVLRVLRLSTNDMTPIDGRHIPFFSYFLESIKMNL